MIHCLLWTRLPITNIASFFPLIKHLIVEKKPNLYVMKASNAVTYTVIFIPLLETLLFTKEIGCSSTFEHGVTRTSNYFCISLVIVRCCIASQIRVAGGLWLSSNPLYEEITLTGTRFYIDIRFCRLSCWSLDVGAIL